MRKIIILTLLLMSILGTCSAEKQEWFDKNYDFKSAKRVFIFEPSVDKKIINGINEKQISEIFLDKTKIEKVKIVRLPEVIASLKADIGIDIVELSKTNPQEAANILNSNLYRYADIIICSNILEYGFGSQYREPFSYNTTSYQNSYIYGPNGGVGTIQTPVTQNHTIPGRNVPTAYVTVKFDAYDSKTFNPVFTRIENRVRPEGLGKPEPKDLYERITNSFFEDISSKIN